MALHLPSESRQHNGRRIACDSQRFMSGRPHVRNHGIREEESWRCEECGEKAANSQRGDALRDSGTDHQQGEQGYADQEDCLSTISVGEWSRQSWPKGKTQYEGRVWHDGYDRGQVQLDHSCWNR